MLHTKCCFGVAPCRVPALTPCARRPTGLASTAMIKIALKFTGHPHRCPQTRGFTQLLQCPPSRTRLVCSSQAKAQQHKELAHPAVDVTFGFLRTPVVPSTQASPRNAGNFTSPEALSTSDHSRPTCVLRSCASTASACGSPVNPFRFSAYSSSATANLSPAISYAWLSGAKILTLTSTMA